MSDLSVTLPAGTPVKCHCSSCGCEFTIKTTEAVEAYDDAIWDHIASVAHDAGSRDGLCFECSEPLLEKEAESVAFAEGLMGAA